MSVRHYLKKRIALLILLLIPLVVAHCAGRPQDSPAFAIHTIAADDTALRLAHQAGATAVLQLFEWRNIEPQPGEYHWEYPDFVVRACEYYDLELIMRLDHPPDWATQPSNQPGSPIDLDAFETFVSKVAARYRGRVDAYIVWNEPNLAREWNGRSPDPAEYAELLETGCHAIKAAAPEAFVISAGLAPTNQNDATAMDDRLFLRKMLETRGSVCFDSLGVHPYGFGFPPDISPDSNNGLNVQRLVELHQILSEHGLPDKPIWITEIGWTVAAVPADVWMQVTPEEQASYLLKTFDLAGTEWPWVELIAVWNLSAGLPADDEKRGYSITDDSYQPLPAYTALADRFGRESIIHKVAHWLDERTTLQEPIEILAADVPIRLGDRDTFYPHWARIYGGSAPSLHWAGTFYVRNPGNRLWQLTMEIMQVEEQRNLVRINGQLLNPPAIPVRGKPDFTSVWTRTSITVPAGILHAGANDIEVFASPRLPPHQGVRYESLQFRNIQLEPMTER